jgi:hypothetical protein
MASGRLSWKPSGACRIQTKPNQRPVVLGGLSEVMPTSQYPVGEEPENEGESVSFLVWAETD